MNLSINYIKKYLKIQSTLVIRDPEGLTDFFPYLGFPLLPICIYIENKARYTTNISRERWAGALMEVRSLFGLNSKTGYGPTDRRTDRWMDGRSLL